MKSHRNEFFSPNQTFLVLYMIVNSIYTCLKWVW